MNEFSIAMSLTNIIFVLLAHFLGPLHARQHSPAETSFGIFGAELFYTTLPTLQMLRFASVLSIPSWTRTIHFLSVWVEICLKWWCFRILFVCTDAFLCACACTCMWNSQCMQINVHCLNKNTETSYCLIIVAGIDLLFSWHWNSWLRLAVEESLKNKNRKQLRLVRAHSFHKD